MQHTSDLVQSAANCAPQPDPNYWHGLVNEKVAAEFLGLSDRSMQSYRQRGGGPRFVRVSSNCIRYRRIDLKAWAEARLTSSTSDQSAAA